MMLGKNSHSHAVVERLPRNSVGAEIGVWRGDTSELFLRSGKVRHLHLVDSWSVGAYAGVPGYSERYAMLVGSRDPEAFQVFYDRVHASVVSRFRGQPVTVHRLLSREFWRAPIALDWVYIDAGHEYDDVMLDLDGASRKVSLIFGDDYGNKEGVYRAVNDFVGRTGWRFERFETNQYEIRSGD
jgi:hypothetical protein